MTDDGSDLLRDSFVIGFRYFFVIRYSRFVITTHVLMLPGVCLPSPVFLCSRCRAIGL
jgi:hypothetical protein